MMYQVLSPTSLLGIITVKCLNAAAGLIIIISAMVSCLAHGSLFSVTSSC